MVIFNNNNFQDPSVNYLTFDDDFKIDINLNKIKVLLGPNGVGKSTIYRCIEASHPEYEFIDYEDVENSIKAFGNSLIIAAKVAVIEDKSKQLQSIKDSLDTSKIMKDRFGIKSKAACQNISSDLNDYRTDTFKAIDHFQKDRIESLFNIDDGDKIVLANHGKTIIEQANIAIEIDNVKNEYREKYLKIIEQTLENEDTICPICGHDTGESIKVRISSLLAEIDNSTNTIVKQFIEKYPDENPSQLVNKINELRQIIIDNAITTEDLENFIICGGSLEKANEIIQNKIVIQNLRREINELNDEKEQFYNVIKNSERNIREIFENQLKVPGNNITFDDNNHELHIDLERNIDSYSTGEINLITLIVSLLEFMNSDKNTLIIDDPLSSYDLPNQYRIIYEIASIQMRQPSQILILTHNIDCINISNSQNKRLFEYEIIDRINDKLYINKIDNLPDKGFHIDYILNQIDDGYQYKKYLMLLSEKDEWDPNDERHKLFHYDDVFNYTDPTTGANYSNQELVGLIDNIGGNVINNDTIINSANKIMYLAALRVWIEKQLYDHCDNKTELSDKRLLALKIKYSFDEHHWTGTTNVDKSLLMQKKVMLNQNDHSDSQKEPFYYALSISTDNIISDIIDLKSHFEI